jgi:hypothetical protein
MGCKWLLAVVFLEYRVYRVYRVKTGGRRGRVKSVFRFVPVFDLVSGLVSGQVPVLSGRVMQRCMGRTMFSAKVNPQSELHALRVGV